MPEIQNPGPAVSESAIRELESTLGQVLPDDYRTFLLKYNGGTPQPKEFSLSRVRYFYALNGSETSESLEEALSLYDELVEQNLLPIGEDSFGNQIVLQLETGAILFWDHEEEENPLTTIAGTFLEFLTGLT